MFQSVGVLTNVDLKKKFKSQAKKKIVGKSVAVQPDVQVRDEHKKLSVYASLWRCVAIQK